MSTLVCPKCQGEMRVYERNGVTLDQCEECRGIFLDRGELERLVDAEARFSQPAAPQGAPPPPQGGYPPPPQGGYPPQQQPYPPRNEFWEGLFGGGHHGNRRHH